jgi:hypothetical protein
METIRFSSKTRRATGLIIRRAANHTPTIKIAVVNDVPTTCAKADAVATDVPSNADRVAKETILAATTHPVESEKTPTIDFDRGEIELPIAAISENMPN